MHGNAAFSALDGLNGLEHGTAGVLDAAVEGHGLTHTAGGVHTGTAGFVGEADVVGVDVAVEMIQVGEVRSLPVLELHHGILGGHGNNTRGQNNEVAVKVEVHAKQGVGAGHDDMVAVFLN